MHSKASKSLLLDEMRTILRREGYALATENSYCDWVKRFVRFHQFSSREAMLLEAAKKVEQFLTHLAVEKNVAPSTQNQALNALVFCYSKVLQAPFSDVKASRSRKQPRIPVVLSKEEVNEVLSTMEGVPALVTKLLYASGLRITEAVRLRVQDIDFDYKQITVRDGKGKKDRVTPLSQKLVPLLKDQLQRVQTLHQQDLNAGYGSVYLPYALARKYPNSEYELGWQYLFPSGNLSIDPRSAQTRRHHLDQSTVNKAIKRAVKQCGITKRVSAHTFRHSFATHLLQTGTDIRTLQALLGHANLQTTMIYTHVLKQGGKGVVSPFDQL